MNSFLYITMCFFRSPKVYLSLHTFRRLQYSRVKKATHFHPLFLKRLQDRIRHVCSNNTILSCVPGFFRPMRTRTRSCKEIKISSFSVRKRSWITITEIQFFENATTVRGPLTATSSTSLKPKKKWKYKLMSHFHTPYFFFTNVKAKTELQVQFSPVKGPLGCFHIVNLWGQPLFTQSGHFALPYHEYLISSADDCGLLLYTYSIFPNVNPPLCAAYFYHHHCLPSPRLPLLSPHTRFSLFFPRNREDVLRNPRRLIDE